VESVRYLERLVQEKDRPENLVRILGNIYVKNKEWAKVRRHWTWALTVAKEGFTFRQAKAALDAASRHGY
jgi:uncharacterized protein HemY